MYAAICSIFLFIFYSCFHRLSFFKNSEVKLVVCNCFRAVFFWYVSAALLYFSHSLSLPSSPHLSQQFYHQFLMPKLAVYVLNLWETKWQEWLFPGPLPLLPVSQLEHTQPFFLYVYSLCLVTSHSASRNSTFVNIVPPCICFCVLLHALYCK